MIKKLIILIFALCLHPLNCHAHQYGMHIILPEQKVTEDTFIVLSLPVVAGNEYTPSFFQYFGNFLQIISDHNLADKFNCIFVAFEYPHKLVAEKDRIVGGVNRETVDYWYVNSKDNREITSESDVLSVYDKIKTLFPRQNIFILGYSKSGFGAMHLLLKHPELFEGVAIYDAPLMNDYKLLSSAPQASIRYNFQSYSEDDFNNLIKLPSRVHALSSYAKFIWLGIDNSKNSICHFTAMEKFNTVLDNNAIKHIVKYYEELGHAWNAAWITDALAAMKDFSMRGAPGTRPR